MNTVSRPPADRCALTVSGDGLKRVRGVFSRPCEVIAESRSSRQVRLSAGDDVDEQIVAFLSRRPCTVEGIAAGLGLRPNEVLKRLEALCRKGAVRSRRQGDAVFYEGARDR